MFSKKNSDNLKVEKSKSTIENNSDNCILKTEQSSDKNISKSSSNIEKNGENKSNFKSNNDVNINLNSNKNNNKSAQVKDFFNQNKKINSIQDQDINSNKIETNIKVTEKGNDELNSDVVFSEKDIKLQKFIKDSKYGNKNEENSSNLDLASSYKMLIQLSQLAQQAEVKTDNGISLNDIDVIDKELENLSKNVSDINLNKENDEGIKDDIINTKEVVDENNETIIGYENPEIVLKSNQEVQIMIQDLINCIGERLYKFAYKIVWDNVRFFNIDSY